MRKTLRLLAILASAFVIIASHTPAQAQLLHTWVASNGNDSANCDRPTPCASFFIANNKTAAGGEITCVDSGNYGFVVIFHSLTINCEGAIGSSTQAGGANISTISISNTSASDVVTLRGLDLDGASQSSNAPYLVQVTSPVTLRLEKMRIASIHGGPGIQFQPNGSARLHVSDSIIVNNAIVAPRAGILIQPSAGVTSVTIERTVVDNNLFGIFADGTLGAPSAAS